MLVKISMGDEGLQWLRSYKITFHYLLTFIDSLQHFASDQKKSDYM